MLKFGIPMRVQGFPMRLFLYCLLLSLTLTACGSKGELYLPERQYPQKAQ